MGDRGNGNRGEDVFRGARGLRGRRGNSGNVWRELPRAGWTKERDLARLSELQAESGQAPNPLSAFKFKSLTQKKLVRRVACVSSLESRF